MSQKVINWAYSQVTGFPEIKFVLVMLATDANAAGEGNTTLKQLSRDTDLDASKLPGILQSLENFGMAFASIDADGTIRYRPALDRPGKLRR